MSWTCIVPVRTVVHRFLSLRRAVQDFCQTWRTRYRPRSTLPSLSLSVAQGACGGPRARSKTFYPRLRGVCPRISSLALALRRPPPRSLSLHLQSQPLPTHLAPHATEVLLLRVLSWSRPIPIILASSANTLWPPSANPTTKPVFTSSAIIHSSNELALGPLEVPFAVTDALLPSECARKSSSQAQTFRKKSRTRPLGTFPSSIPVHSCSWNGRIPARISNQTARSNALSTTYSSPLSSTLGTCADSTSRARPIASTTSTR